MAKDYPRISDSLAESQDIIDNAPFIAEGEPYREDWIKELRKRMHSDGTSYFLGGYVEGYARQHKFVVHELDQINLALDGVEVMLMAREGRRCS